MEPYLYVDSFWSKSTQTCPYDVENLPGFGENTDYITTVIDDNGVNSSTTAKNIAKGKWSLYWETKNNCSLILS